MSSFLPFFFFSREEYQDISLSENNISFCHSPFLYFILAVLEDCLGLDPVSAFTLKKKIMVQKKGQSTTVQGFRIIPVDIHKPMRIPCQIYALGI